MNEGQIGTQMSIRAVVHVGMMLIYAPVNRKLGTVRLYQVSPIIDVCMYACVCSEMNRACLRR
jgi:hypothetical protein